MTRKRIISMMLVLLLLIASIGIMPVTVSAVGNGPVIEEDGYRAVCYEDGTAMLIEASVDEEHVVVPETIGDYVITEITEAYNGNTKIKSVTIPDTITGILGNAFRDCKNLESVTIPDSVTEIGGSAFNGCTSLKTVDMSDNVTVIDEGAFYWCKALKEITIPDSVTYIAKEAFGACQSLETINVSQNPELEIEGDAFIDTKWCNSQPDGVVYLDRFALCYKGFMTNNLKIDFKEGTTAVCSGMFYDWEWDADVTALVSVTFPESLRFIGANAFRKCVNLEINDLPDSLTHIGGSAFAYCSSIKSVVVPAGVADMRDAFCHSGLESVTLMGNPDMWYRAFEGCENLKEVNLPDTLVNINQLAFEDCTSLESITIPESVERIEWGAFMDCVNLSDIEHSGKIYKVDSGAFENTAWEASQPDGFLYFGDVLMGYKGNASTLDEVIVKDGVKAVAGSAFARLANLKRVTLPEGLVVIGNNAFRNSAIEAVDVPETVEFIGYHSFVGCSNLTDVVIRGSGTIEYEAFLTCKNLKSVTISASVDEIGDAAFGSYYGMSSMDPLYYEDFTVYGYAGSEAHRYANACGLKFVNLSGDIMGDSDADGRITVKDATLIQKHVAGLATLDEVAVGVSDVTADGNVNVKDATLIQKFVAGIVNMF